jgi:hypothetical protein
MAPCSARQHVERDSPAQEAAMTTASQYEIKCGTCGYWMPAPIAGDAPDAAAHVGSVVQCRKCLQRTTCTSNNLRPKPDGGALA